MCKNAGVQLGEYSVPKEVEAAGFQICGDELGTIVESHLSWIFPWSFIVSLHNNSDVPREQEISAPETRLLEEDSPKNADKFEKLVRTSTNSSFVWIKYMDFLLKLSDIEKAREVAKRFVIMLFCWSFDIISLSEWQIMSSIWLSVISYLLYPGPFRWKITKSQFGCINIPGLWRPSTYEKSLRNWMFGLPILTWERFMENLWR